uniref:Ig-like domain-containing protein n=1 Tax=Angiostrongylus cantonensis TaxID=6313 RepID=A0A0K0D4S6_ANGCA
MLLPIHSTTALMCEAVFSDAENSKAIWYRNGKEVASVSRIFIKQIHNVLEDEGLYWCRHAETGIAGELFSLTVAYVDEIPSNKRIKVEPPQPQLGEQLMLVCPLPNAVPQPTIEWLLNGEPVAHTSSDAHPYPNGTLFIHHFSTLHNGVYECVVWNFAARASSRIVLESKQVANRSGFLESSTLGTRCSLLFRSSILWFLFGCLMSSSSVLIYLLCVLVLMRPTPRSTIVPSMWARSNPLLGPGFRKPIVPVPDFINGAPANDRSGLVRNYEDV